MSKIKVAVVVPVFNEEKALSRCVETLTDFLASEDSRDWQIVIADNGSEDQTAEIASELSAKFDFVHYVRLPKPGRGAAIKEIWSTSDADLLCYMDVDLSTSLAALSPLVNSVAEGGFDIAIGSRLSKDSTVIGRSFPREVVSRAYNFLLKIFFPSMGVSDAQCGFKAVNRWTAQNLVPLIADTGWFFDTEMLIIARRWGLKVAQVPVLWTDDPDSRVKVVSTALKNLKGMVRLRMGGIPSPPTPDENSPRENHH